jgi:hypothetical protein
VRVDQAPAQDTEAAARPANGRDRTADVDEKIAALDRTEAAEIIRGLINRIVLTPKNEDGRRSLSIDLEGALAGVLALAMNGKTPLTGSGSSDAVIALVAGAGFEPATFRL